MGALAILNYHDFYCHFIHSVRLRLAAQRVLDSMLILLLADPWRRHCEVGNLAGAAHLWIDKGKACLIVIFSTNRNCEDMTYQSFRLEECSFRGVRKIPQGYLACGSQAFIATLLFDPSMSALPIIEMQKCQSVGLLTRQYGTWAGLALPIIEIQKWQSVGLPTRQYGTWAGFRPLWENSILRT